MLLVASNPKKFRKQQKLLEGGLCHHVLCSNSLSLAVFSPSGNPDELPYCWKLGNLGQIDDWIEYAKELRCQVLIPGNRYPLNPPLTDLEKEWCTMMLGNKNDIQKHESNRFSWFLEALMDNQCVPYPDGSYSLLHNMLFIPTYVFRNYFDCIQGSGIKSCIRNVTGADGMFYYGVEDIRIYINGYYR